MTREKGKKNHYSPSLKEVMVFPKLHKHYSLFYENEREWLEAIVPFVFSGLEQGHKCIYVVANNVSHIETTFSDAGLDVDKAMESGQLSILRESDVYLKNGNFDPDHMISLLISEVEEALQQGYASLRITGETNWVFQGSDSLEKLFEYETKLNQIVFPNYPCVALCQFDLRKFKPEDIKALIFTHPMLIKKGQVYRNFYYIEPVSYMDQGKKSEHEILCLFDNLEKEKQFQKSLRESEGEYRRLFETMAQGVIYQDAEGAIVSANPAAEQILGLTFDQMQGKTSMDPRWQMINEDGTKISGTEHPVMIALRTGQKVGPVTKGVFHPEKNTHVWLNITAIPLFKPGETKPFQSYATFEDITERKRAEAKIVQSEKILSQTQEIAHIGSWQLDLTVNRLTWSDEVYRIFGCEPQEFAATYEAFLDFIHPDDREEVDNAYSRSLREGSNGYKIDHRIIRRNSNEVRYVHERCIHERDEAGTIIHSTGMVQDITEYVKQENEMRLQNGLITSLLHSIPDLVFYKDLNGKYLGCNQEFTKHLDMSVEEIVGKNDYEIYSREEAENYIYHDQQMLQQQSPCHTEGWLTYPDGRKVFMDTLKAPLLDSNNNVRGILGIGRDITERKKAEQALVESEERFRLLVETAPDSIFLYADKKLAYANQAAASLVEASKPEDIIDTPVMHWLHPDYRSAVEARYRLLLEERQQVPNMEQVYVLPGGEKIDVEVSAVPIRYEGKDGALVYVRNISQRKAAERERMERLQQERHHQKLESIGTLASGVAHEINNPVTGIMNYAQLILDASDPSSENTVYAQEIVTESQRISGIVRDLLFFSRNEKQAHSRADFKEIVERTLKLVKAVMRKDQIQIQVNIPDDLPLLKCRSQQIQQVLMNLITNARDALNDKYPEYHEDKKIQITGYLYKDEGRRWIRLTVEDKGPGIPQNIQERIFDPFFTTKPKERGTGLGMPISYGIVREHHGNLSFETQIGEFTIFHLDLPIDNGWHMEE